MLNQEDELEKLLSQITPEIYYSEIDWGPDVGNEILPPWDGPGPDDPISGAVKDDLKDS